MLKVLYLLSILFSTTLAIINRKFLAEKRITLLIPFLIYTFIQEVIMVLNIQYHFMASSNPFYNIYRPITVLILVLIYYQIPFMYSTRLIMSILTSLYILAVIVLHIFFIPLKSFVPTLAIIRGIVITFFAVLFLLKYFDIDNANDEKFWQPVVWITGSIAVFYPVVTASLSFQNYLSAQKASVFGQKLYQLIPQLMSLFMYSCFSYAFYLCKKLK
jgi:hypothetical protein